jgi:hypothetical protein
MNVKDWEKTKEELVESLTEMLNENREDHDVLKLMLEMVEGARMKSEKLERVIE